MHSTFSLETYLASPRNPALVLTACAQSLLTRKSDRKPQDISAPFRHHTSLHPEKPRAYCSHDASVSTTLCRIVVTRDRLATLRAEAEKSQVGKILVGSILMGDSADWAFVLDDRLAVDVTTCDLSVMAGGFVTCILESGPGNYPRKPQ
ncbi:hypothetical protein DOTSEDRAFT_34822 [Dothistroma septosporum NZE10]|uniref:Uncharacterized protein n=1 Tax=Dothistroma septosporum (strain NZE10 / CBS 128990) TaxID=675120 RepID=N1PPR0_DOTSN|nr:hypothetical protein DOTSEDRAFT_34822 [Dothistroma septosporum NZE10]